MAPGIEPGNLIRSTLIRYPPGPFFVKLSNKVTGVTEQNAVENKVVYPYIFYYVLLCHACNVIAMFLCAFDRNYQQNKINKLTPTLILPAHSISDLYSSHCCLVLRLTLGKFIWHAQQVTLVYYS